MKDLHLRVGQIVNDESISLLTSFLSGLDGVLTVRVVSNDIGILYDEQRIPDERIFAVTKSSVELLGYHLAYS